MTFKNCKLVIEKGMVENSRMFEMLDVFLLAQRITDEEYLELSSMLMTGEEAQAEEMKQGE